MFFCLNNKNFLGFVAIRKKLADILKGNFVRSVTVLVGGTAFAQMIMVLALPLITRLYTPADFSVLAVYMSLLGFISVAACLRFDVSVPIPELDADAANLLALALLFGVIFSGVASILVFFFPIQISTLIGNKEIRPYLWLVPLGVFFASSYSSMQFWATRKKAFRAIAMTRMTQALGGVSAQGAMGLAGIAPFGLLLGHIVSSGAGSLGLVRKAIREDKEAIKSIKPKEMKRLFREFSRFPKFSTIEALANAGAIQLPIIFIAGLAIGPEAGFLMLAMRVMQAPMSLLGSAVGQVYLSRAADEYRSDNLGHFTADVLGGLFKVGVGPLLFAGIVAPQVFPIVFGEGWGRAGILVCWMTPWFIMQFLTSPISMALHITNNQKIAMGLQIFGFVFRGGCVFFASAFFAEKVSEVYAVSGFLFYTIYLLIVGALVGLDRSLFFRRVISGAAVFMVWVGGAVIISIAAQ